MHIIVENRSFDVQIAQGIDPEEYPEEARALIIEATIIGLIDEFQWSDGDLIDVVFVDDAGVQHEKKVSIFRRWDAVVS